jgi:hypothetical protein
MPETFRKKGVEIFSVGKWNGDEYTHDDLNEMVKAFEETKQGAQPYLKLGHDPKQKLVQEDGLPAAGWIEKMYIVGDKLVADFCDIPKKIYDLIEMKAYKKVSCEIFWNLKIGSKTYKRMVAAVALLGANTPGVMNLSDIMAMYKSVGKDCDDIKAYDNALEFSDSEIKNLKGGKMEKTEKEVKLEYDLQKTESELKATNEKLSEAEKLQAAKDKEIADLKKFKADAEAKEQQLLADAKAANLKTFVGELKAEKLCTPSMEPLVTQLLGDEKKEYSVKIQEKEQKLSKEQLFKETLKLFKAASEVNFEESSEQGEEKTEQKNYENMDKKAKEYMEKNGCSYGQAMKAVMKEQKQK